MDKEELKQIYVSIHTLRMEGDWDNTSVFSLAHQISIHTLRMEGDDSISDKVAAIKAFQSTPSAWRVTHRLGRLASCVSISIHTLRMEGDFSGFCSASL